MFSGVYEYFDCARYRHSRRENQVRPRGIDRRPFRQKLRSNLIVIDNYNGLAHDSDRADGA